MNARMPRWHKPAPTASASGAGAFAEHPKVRATVLVVDTGGTTFDVSLVRDHDIATTAETWLGERFTGHMLGVPAVDARTVGAGGGSIAWLDVANLLRAGPQSAGAVPGPACYGARRPGADGDRRGARTRLHRSGILPRGPCDARAVRGASLEPAAVIAGPALIEEETTTVVIPPGLRTRLSEPDSFIVDLMDLEH